MGGSRSTSGPFTRLLLTANCACLEASWQELVSAASVLASSCPPGGHAFSICELQLPRPMPQWPRRAAWRTKLSRHISRLERMCISEIGAWLWSQVFFLHPHPTTCPRGAQRAELAGPACWLSGWGCRPVGMVSGLLRARVLEPGARQASAAERHPSCKDCRRSGQPSGLPGVRHRAARLCFCRTLFVSAFFILLLHCLVVCGQQNPTAKRRWKSFVCSDAQVAHGDTGAHLGSWGQGSRNPGSRVGSVPESGPRLRGPARVGSACRGSSPCTGAGRQTHRPTPATQRPTPGPGKPGLRAGRASVISGFIKRLLMKVTHGRGRGQPSRGAASRRNVLVKTCNERHNKSPILGKAVVKSLSDSDIFSGARTGLYKPLW